MPYFKSLALKLSNPIALLGFRLNSCSRTSTSLISFISKLSECLLLDDETQFTDGILSARIFPIVAK